MAVVVHIVVRRIIERALEKAAELTGVRIKATAIHIADAVATGPAAEAATLKICVGTLCLGIVSRYQQTKQQQQCGSL
jgi:hypothetical protein